MENFTIEFEFSGSKIQLQCKGDDIMKDTFQKFVEKVHLQDNMDDFIYLYNGQNLSESSNLNLRTIISKGDYENGTMKIVSYLNKKKTGTVIKSKSKYIICPKCEENCLLNIKDYKIFLSECKNEHKINNIRLNEFDDTQNIEESKIKCDGCFNRNKSDTYESTFYICLTCSKKLCPLCFNEHDKDHIIIDYDRKNNVCNKHGKENFISYCKDCKLNLCFLCEESHLGHNIIKLSQIMPNLKKIRDQIEGFKEKIMKVNELIDEIIQKINKIPEGLEKLLNINIDLVNSYSLDNRTYQLFFNVNNIINNINLKDVDDIIDEKNIYNQFKILLKMYNKMMKNDIYYVTPEENKNDEKNETTPKGEFNSEDAPTPKGEISSPRESSPKKEICPKNEGNQKKPLNQKSSIDKNNYTKKGNVTNNNCEITIKYNIKKSSKIRIFGETFVKNNINNCKYIYNNTEYTLEEFFDTKSIINKNDELVIKLKQTGEMTNLSDMFNDCESLKSLPDICNFDTSNVIYMNGMFRGCKSLCEISDISKWDTSNVKDMSEMFHNCISLKKLPDISKWNVSNVSNKSEMFYNCNSLESLPDISKWNINNVTNNEIMSSGSPNSLNIPHIY